MSEPYVLFAEGRCEPDLLYAAGILLNEGVYLKFGDGDDDLAVPTMEVERARTEGRAARVVAVIRPSRMAVSQPDPPPRPAASAAAIPLGQSSAAQTTSARTNPPGPTTEGSGVHGAAHKARPVTGPGKIRSPSPGRRLIPQTKQSGNTGLVK